MMNFILLLVVTIAALSIIMETLKEIIEGIANKIKKKQVAIPAYVWQIISVVLTAAAMPLLNLILTRHPQSQLELFTDSWMLLIWMPVIWWGQLQMDMKVVKEFLGPALKKIVSKFLGV